MSVTQLFRASLCVGFLTFTGTAIAQENPGQGTLAQPPSDNAAVMSADELGAFSGGTGVTVDVLTQGSLNAVNSGNSVSGNVVSSGDLNIGANAFSGYQGIGNFVINTGHNNNLQSNMSVSVVITPPSTPGS